MLFHLFVLFVLFCFYSHYSHGTTFVTFVFSDFLFGHNSFSSASLLHIYVAGTTLLVQNESDVLTSAQW